jgi:hypothetical protein
MAIEQFDELETRHHFLTTQRKDLVDSIASTNEAIKRIDETSTTRFNEAFVAINLNFQHLLDAVRQRHAGITLLDENDPLDSGIDIVASPPASACERSCSRRREGAHGDCLDVRDLQMQPSRSACSTRSTRRSTTRTSVDSWRC